MKKTSIFAVIGFALGLLFYKNLLDKPERQYIIKRLNQKKGAGNVMDVSQSEMPLGTISGSMTRRQVISVWKELKNKK